MRRTAVLLFVVLAALVGDTASLGAGPAPTVRVRLVRLVDHSRLALFRNGSSGPRVLMTEVRYPRVGHAPFPLVVFAHGFDETPAAYVGMLDTWARAGYVVAAPVFPVEGANAPGGASESDLVNEPGDLSFVISRLTAPASPVRRLVDATSVAVVGQSDGGEAALSVAYDRRFRDPRIDAAIVLSGAALPGFSQPPAASPPLLAVQGTNDALNSPATTADYFRRMRRPKFLLSLLGASHLEPYTTNNRWARVVRSATTAFLDRYLRGAPLPRLIEAGTKAGVARMTSNP